MEDEKIVELYVARSEQAIEETQKKYGKYCLHIAKNILGAKEDAEECRNDILLKLWQSIPTARPRNLKAYVGTMSRRTALDALEEKNREKQSHPRLEEALEELSECLSDSFAEDPAQTLIQKETVNGFLSSLKPKERQIFMRRYFYIGSIEEVARACGVTKSDVKVTLFRLRKKLKEYLKKC